MSNLDHFYQSLPTRFRRDDKTLFLKRYLQFIGETLDDYDDQFDGFFENINPATASEDWIEFWLRELFGWSWFPTWFTLFEKRRLYGNFAKHLARRGTAKGIELWLADFNITAKVYNQPTFYGEMVWGESNIFVTDPLIIVVDFKYAEQNYQSDMFAVGDGAWGEAFYSTYLPLFTQPEWEMLLRFIQPHSQHILLVQTENEGSHFFGAI